MSEPSPAPSTRFPIVVALASLVGVVAGFGVQAATAGDGDAASGGATVSTLSAPPTTNATRRLTGLECAPNGSVSPVPQPSFLAWSQATGLDGTRLQKQYFPATVLIPITGDLTSPQTVRRLRDASARGRGVVILTESPGQLQLIQDMGGVADALVIVAGRSQSSAGYPPGSIFLVSEVEPPLYAEEASIARLIGRGEGACSPVANR